MHDGTSPNLVGSPLLEPHLLGLWPCLRLCRQGLLSARPRLKIGRRYAATAPKGLGTRWQQLASCCSLREQPMSTAGLGLASSRPGRWLAKLALQRRDGDRLGPQSGRKARSCCARAKTPPFWDHRVVAKTWELRSSSIPAPQGAPNPGALPEPGLRPAGRQPREPAAAPSTWRLCRKRPWARRAAAKCFWPRPDFGWQGPTSPRGLSGCRARKAQLIPYETPRKLGVQVVDQRLDPELARGLVAARKARQTVALAKGGDLGLASAC